MAGRRAKARAGRPPRQLRAASITIATLGLLSIEHDGSIGWSELQAIKNRLAGENTAAIEVYSPASRVVNNIEMRHLWLFGRDDWWPDFSGEDGTATLSTLRDGYLTMQRSGGGSQ